MRGAVRFNTWNTSMPELNPVWTVKHDNCAQQHGAEMFPNNLYIKQAPYFPLLTLSFYLISLIKLLWSVLQEAPNKPATAGVPLGPPQKPSNYIQKHVFA